MIGYFSRFLPLCELHYSEFAEDDWCYNQICHVTRSYNSLYDMQRRHDLQLQVILVSRMLLNSGCS